MAVIAPNGPYEIKNSPKCVLDKAPWSPRPPRQSLVGPAGAREAGGGAPVGGTTTGPLGSFSLSPLGSCGPGAAEWALASTGKSDKEPYKEELGKFSVFCNVRSELLRPILGLLDPV